MKFCKSLSARDKFILLLLVIAWGGAMMRDGIIAMFALGICLSMILFTMQCGYSRDDKRQLQLNEAIFPVYAMVLPMLVSCVISYIPHMPTEVKRFIEQYAPLLFLCLITMVVAMIILYHRDVNRRIELEEKDAHFTVVVNHQAYDVEVRKGEKEDNTSQ